MELYVWIILACCIAAVIIVLVYVCFIRKTNKWTDLRKLLDLFGKVLMILVGLKSSSRHA